MVPLALAWLLLGPCAAAASPSTYRSELQAVIGSLGPRGSNPSPAALLRAASLLPTGKVDLSFLRRQLEQAARQPGNNRAAMASAARDELALLERDSLQAPAPVDTHAASRLHRILSAPPFSTAQSPAWLRAITRFLGGLVNWTVAGVGLALLGIFLVLIIAALALRAGGWREAANRAKQESPKPPRAAETHAAARAAAAEGRFQEAVRLLFRAILLYLAETGRLTLRPAATDADYLQEIGAIPALDQATDLFRRTWYGLAPCGQEEFRCMERLLDATRRGDGLA